jgi:hypothetical protein
MTRACGADDIKNILHPALFRKLRFQMIDDIPTRPVQQMLHSVGSRFPHPLRQLPAVLALAVTQQTLKI